MIRNIIFDWSGTLVDDLPAVLKASNFVLTQSGKSAMSLEQFRAEFQLPFTKFYDSHTPGVPMEKLEDWFHAEFKRSQSSVVELPHAREFLEFCRAKKLRTFLLSTVHADHFKAQCRVTGFDAFLDKPYTDVWDKREKIHEILAENNLKPVETIFIGDMQHDIETARHGGVHSCAVLTGYNTLSQLREAKPDLIVEHLSELRGLLEQNDFDPKPLAKKFEENRPPIATVGSLTVSPGASNVIPAEAVLTLDVRHPRDAMRRAALRALQGRAARIARRRRLTLSWEQTQDDNAVACSRQLTMLLAQSVRAQQGRCVELTSGAGHDAVTMATMASIAMLFVRCRGGLSHHADEYVAPTDIAMALRVLVDFLERLAGTIK